MEAAILPDNEAARLTSLLALNILDTPQESDYDEITRVAAEICQTPISLVSFVDKNRQWFKSHSGLDTKETPREHAFCSHAILQSEVFEICDAREDARFHDNPLVTGHPEVIFYAGVPLSTVAGCRLGTLCVIDNKPKKLTSAQKNALIVLGHQVEAQLKLRLRNQKIAELGKRLLQEQQSAKTHYQKISQLGCLQKYDIDYHMSPLAILSGDTLLSAESNSSDNALHLVLADTTNFGGLDAAMGLLPITTSFYIGMKNASAPEDIIRSMNDVVRQFCPLGHFCAICYLIIDYNAHTIKFWNAGMPYPKHYNAAKATLVDFHSQSVALGGIDNSDINIKFVEINYTPGEQFIIFTNSLLDISNQAGQMLDNETLRQFMLSISETKTLSAETLMHEITTFAADSQLCKNVTLVNIPLH